MAGFVPAGPRTSLYTPASPSLGELVIICTWLGAASKHIAKYVDLYKRVAPGARILLIESNVPILVSSYARQRRHLHNAVAAVLDTLTESGFHGPRSRLEVHEKKMMKQKAKETGSSNTPESTDATSISRPESPPSSQPSRKRPGPKVVLQAFSNGGTNTATQLLITLQQRTSKPLPLHGIILDSAPAKGTYAKSYNAMVLSLPGKDPASRALGALAVHFLLVLLYTWIACGNENPADLMRRTLLDEGAIAGNGGCGGGDVGGQGGSGGDGESVNAGTTVRDKERPSLCYVYSKSDSMVEWTDISDHAAAARHLYRQGQGTDGAVAVKEVRFGDSAHCAHFSRYEAEYGRAVEEMWRGDVASGIERVGNARAEAGDEEKEEEGRRGAYCVDGAGGRKRNAFPAKI